ncbi:Transposable element tcb2 transposase [Caligus rogercresseyi]|uniref:Transposable element tcb2 transposase n=1 Tax=Caligus rogercresseyi TaxID=217165 RepID=A0A7T8GWA0_CALRO|nr:Transposable element tcb2 transposase [Caligus rogercresseyi]
MVLGVISSEGHVMPPHFFEPKQKVNQEVYLEVLSNVVKPWIDTVASGRKYTFQQDSPPPQGQDCAGMAQGKRASLLGSSDLALQLSRSQPL